MLQWMKVCLQTVSATEPALSGHNVGTFVDNGEPVAVVADKQIFQKLKMLQEKMQFYKEVGDLLI